MKLVKPVFFVVFILASTYHVFSQTKEFEAYTNDAEIEVILSGAPAGNVRLIIAYGDTKLLKDSAIADATGKVVFKNTKRYDAGIYYAVYTDNSYLAFIMDKNQHFYLHSKTSDPSKNLKTNSAENLLFYSNSLFEDSINKKVNAINTQLKTLTKDSKEYNNATKEKEELINSKEKMLLSYQNKHAGSFFVAFKTMGQNPKLQKPKLSNGELDTIAQVIIYRNEYWNNFDFNDGRMVYTPMYYNKLKNYMTLFPQRADSLLEGAKFLLKNSDKGHKEIFQFTINYFLNTYKKSTVMGGEKIMCYAIDNYYTYEKIFWADSLNVQQAQVKANQIRPSLLGAVGQDLKCKNEKGEYVSLYSLQAKAKIVFLYNPDCDHCKKETPKLKALYEKWKPKGLEVYALNVEKDYDQWTKFIQQYQLTWTNVIDTKYESKFYAKYHADMTPGLYVLDSNNIIVSKQLMPDQLDSILEELTK